MSIQQTKPRTISAPSSYALPSILAHLSQFIGDLLRVLPLLVSAARPVEFRTLSNCTGTGGTERVREGYPDNPPNPRFR